MLKNLLLSVLVMSLITTGVAAADQADGSAPLRNIRNSARANGSLSVTVAPKSRCSICTDAVRPAAVIASATG